MYDPLIDTSIGCNQAYPTSYWADISGNAPHDDGQIKQDIHVDVAIIGAGYTGLSCALALAKDYGIKAHVLEANRTAWGCSGRNAGFILKSSGRKSYAAIAEKWGADTMRAIYSEMAQGVDRVKSLITQMQPLGIDCQQQSAGFLKVAHKPSMMKNLLAQAKLQQKTLADLAVNEIEVLSEQEVRQHYMDDKNAFGAIRYQDGFGLNPLRLAWGYHLLAQQAGAKIHCASPVIAWHSDHGKQCLVTPQGIVHAQKVVIATNGYTPKNFHPLITARTLPVLSQIIVTEPLTPAQIDACNFLTENVIMDTRALKYYYRKLPDNRILFGGRGAITGKSAENSYYADRLLAVLKTSFPALKTLKYDYTWAGWICMALDDIPHLYQSADQSVFYAMGYCGSGVSFSSQAGKRLADKVAEQSIPQLPLYNQPLPKFPFASLRRLGQWGYFHYGKLKDSYL
jgi:glycine/D-amino acid oxidase-like deaminating enzyme